LISFAKLSVFIGRIKETHCQKGRSAHFHAVAEDAMVSAYFRKDGSRVPVLVGGAMFEGSGNEGGGFRARLERQLTPSNNLTLLGIKVVQSRSQKWIFVNGPH